MDIVLNEYRVDGLTGRMEIDVQSVTQVSPNQKITGPIKTYGIEPGAVQIAHDGSIEKWLAWVKQEHIKFCGINQDMVSKISAAKGKTL